MKEYLLRHLATSHAGTRVATAHFERTVLIWDISTGRAISQFDTILDFGGRRLAISPEGEVCVAGACYVHGVACYGTEDGAMRWQRKDLKAAQSLTISQDGTRLYCCFDDRSYQVLDLATGATIGAFCRAENVYESPFQDVRFLDKGRPELQTKAGEPIAVVQCPNLVRTAAFGPETLCISTGRGPVRCFDVQTGAQLWQCNPNQGHTVLEVTYATGRGQFVGVEWPNQRGGSKRLVAYEGEAGSSVTLCSIGEPAETAFCSEGNLLVTTDGSLISTTTGEVVRTLPLEAPA